MDAFDSGGEAFLGEPGGPAGNINDPAMVAARQAAIDAAPGGDGAPPGAAQVPPGDGEDQGDGEE